MTTDQNATADCKKYKRQIDICLKATFSYGLLCIVVATWTLTKNMQEQEENFYNTTTSFNINDLNDCLRRIILAVGCMFFIGYLIEIIIFIHFFKKLSKLIDQYQNQLENQRCALNRLSLFFLITYFIRLITLLGFGFYDQLISSMFLRQELYIVLAFISDAPSIFFFYLTHSESFKV